MNQKESLRLDEIGERAIIKEILASRYGQTDADYFGNDCALISNDFSSSSAIIATTDPCPEPMASLLGFDDLYYWGWLLATINISDIAAAGARPLGLLTSLILPNDTSIAQFLRLLDGIDECCHSCDTKVVGGNLKEGPKMMLSATAIGVCEKNFLLSRAGCKAGDLIVVIGDLGLFWAGVLMKRRGINAGIYEEKLLKNILTPTPKVKIAQIIAEKKLLTACIDNSDGLYPSLEQLADTNNLQMHVKMDEVQYAKEVEAISVQTNIAPVRMALGWGDWQLIGCCKPEKLAELQSLGSLYSETITVIGEIQEGKGVILSYKGESGEMAPVDSQRFTQNSWFTYGIESYEKMLIEDSLWKK